MISKTFRVEVESWEQEEIKEREEEMEKEEAELCLNWGGTRI